MSGALTLRPEPARLAACGSLVAASVAVALATARSPVAVLVSVAVLAGLWLLLPRLTLVTALVAAGFFYDDWLTDAFGFWNPGKLVGLLAVASLVLSLVADRRPIVWAPQLPVLAALAGSLLISDTFARDQAAAFQASVRYVMFFGLFFIVAQAVRSRADIHWIIDVTIFAATVAALFGLRNYLTEGYTRVGGPIHDPGDFGFVLSTTLPLVLYRVVTSTGAARLLRLAALVVIGIAVLGTFARADVLGLAVAGGWVLATGRVRLRWGVVASLVVVTAVLLAFRLQPTLVESSLVQKQAVAASNVESRLGLWTVAVEEWRSSPVFGVGAGNYEVRLTELRSPFRLRVETTHNAYLNVLAELGAVGLLLFGTFLALSWRELRWRRRWAGDADPLRIALAAGFVVALVAAFFMTQQLYPPLWFLAALGTALNRLESSPIEPAAGSAAAPT